MVQRIVVLSSQSHIALANKTENTLEGNSPGIVECVACSKELIMERANGQGT